MPVPELGVVDVDVRVGLNRSSRIAFVFRTSESKTDPHLREEILSRRWVAKSDYGLLSFSERTQLIEEIQKWNAQHDPIIKPVAPAPATARLPLHGDVSLSVVRDGENYRKTMTGEHPHDLYYQPFLTDISGHNAGDYIQIAEDAWVSNSHPIDPSLLPHVLAEIERWKAEQSPKIENKPPAYSAENKGSPDAMIAWLRRDKSALATDAADEIERLRGWLLRMYEQAARNNWHIYSCVAHDALTGKPVPERKVQV